jgi:hypothetical protein
MTKHDILEDKYLSAKENKRRTRKIAESYGLSNNDANDAAIVASLYADIVWAELNSAGKKI